MRKFSCNCLILCLLLGVVLLGCNNNGNGDESKKSTSLNDTITGSISSIVNDDNLEESRSDMNNCAGSHFTVYSIGGGGEALSTGTASGSSFSADVNPDNEVVINFEKCNQKCFGKPGTTGLVCDPISDAVVRSLEKEMNASLTEDKLFNGLSISKIAEGMVESLKFMYRLDPSSTIIDSLISANSDDDSDAMRDIIKASSVGVLFDSLGTLAEEKKAENSAIAEGSTADEAKETAARKTWSAEKVVNMMIGMGISINAMVYNDSTGLYSDLFGALDNPGKFEFVAMFRKYLSDLYKDTIKDKEISNVALVCEANPVNWSDDGKTIYFPPTTNGEIDVTINGTPHTITKLKCDGTSASLDGTYEVNGLKLIPSKSEANRNDPEGKHANEHDFNNFTMSFVNILDGFNTTLQAYIANTLSDDYAKCGLKSDNFQYGPDIGSNSDDLDQFSACLADSGADQYFAGLMGIYRFMIDFDFNSKKFSLEDIHKVLKKSIRVVGETPFGGSGLHVTVTDIPAKYCGTGNTCTRDIWVPMVLQDYTDNSTLWNPDKGLYSFKLECPEEICGSDGKIEPGETVEMTYEKYSSLMDSMAPGYDSMMTMFEDIPTIKEIKKNIFESAHHEEWNIAGSEYFYVKGAANDDNSWEAERPVLCKVNKANIVGDFVEGKSYITCEKAEGTWTDGAETGTSKYSKGYYALNEKSKKEDADKYYSLINIANGDELKINGVEFRLKHDSSVSENDTSLELINKEFCDQWTDEQRRIQTNCRNERFYFVNVNLTSLMKTSEFQPYQMNIPIYYIYTDCDEEGNCDTIKEEVWTDLAMSKNSTLNDYSDDFAVCLKESAVTVDSLDSMKITAVDLTSGNIVNCMTTNEKTFYYLTLNWGQGSSDASNYYLGLVKNDGLWMWSEINSGLGDNYQNKIVQLSTLASNSASLCSDTGVCTNNTGGAHMYPLSYTQKFMMGYQIKNLGHDPRYDPYCDDTNGDGYCACLDSDGTSVLANPGQCTLQNAAATDLEPTMSHAPYTPGDSNSVEIVSIMEKCGNKVSGDGSSNLGDCLQTYIDKKIATDESLNSVQDYLYSVHFDSSHLFTCSNGNKMKYVDLNRLIDSNEDDRVNVGDGCGTEDPWSSETGTYGPVRMRKILARNNAYDISRPQSLIRLMSTAARTVGTGNSIAPDAKVFSFEEALALMLARTSIPVNGRVYGLDQSNPEATDLEELYDFSTRYEKSLISGNENNPVNELLKQFVNDSITK